MIKRILFAIGLLLALHMSVLADDFESAEEEDFGNANLTLDSNDSGGDVQLQFGATLAEFLRWDSANSYFVLSDDLNLQNNELKEFRVDNLAAAPTCDASNAGRLYYDTTAKATYSCDETSWTQVDVEGVLTPFLDANTTYLIKPGDTKTISIIGQNFDPATTVTFTGFGGTVNSTTIINPGQIDVNVTADGVTANYNVVVDTNGVSNTVWAGNGVNALIVAPIVGTGSAGTYTESFEAGLGSYTDGTNGEVAWTRDSGGTPSGNTGPTAASDGTFYIFTEASSPNFPTVDFSIQTTDFAQAQSVSFDYHMFGATMGTLQVQTLLEGTWTTRFTLTGQQQGTQGAAYLNSGVIDLSSFDVQAIRFFYTSGTNFTGDCTIDNISIVSI